MPDSRRAPVPGDLALLFQFVNSVDLRRFAHHGVPHTGGDELASVAQLERWMRRHALLGEGVRLDRAAHRKALELRDSLRAFLQLAPPDRRGTGGAGALVNASAADFPLIVQVATAGKIRLQPRPGAGFSGLGNILAELQHAAETARLDRLKLCAAEDCRWAFYDRSKPATRRWCDSTLCGNREKTRAYRRRRRGPPSRDPH